ncbi:MAG: hypothetical protein AB1540_02660 [Bdellovibrionota bacterium]
MAWLSLVGMGFWQLFLYSNTPGDAALPLQKVWPAKTQLVRDSDKANLVIFAHPHCPCSKATVGELERLIPHIQGKVKSLVVFFKPKAKDEAWVKSDLWQKAQGLSEVQAIVDEDGLEAQRFGAKTSGQAFLYDNQGKLAFQGGLTRERGHMGDSQGRDAILHFIKTGKATLASAPVFGCALKSPERAVARGQQ